MKRLNMPDIYYGRYRIIHRGSQIGLGPDDYINLMDKPKPAKVHQDIVLWIRELISQLEVK